jgi:hypothetical protein
MAVILIPVCFILIVFCLGVSGITSNKKELLISAVPGFCLLALLGTEGLSVFYGINYVSLLVYWLTVALAAIVYLYFKRNKLKEFVASLGQDTAASFKRLNLYEKILAGALFVLLVIIFIQGVAYPPTNYDSMTYHLARITSWVGHGAVSYYPTDLTRQIYQPPFAEYIILHFNLLNRADCFSASVQFCFLCFSLVAIGAIASCMGLNHRSQLFTVIVAATIPEVVLQASSTQNDVVEAFFILAAFYFVLKVISTSQRKDFLLLGLTSGLSLLTKGTGYVYLFPVLMVFGVIMLIRLFKTRNYSLLTNSLLAVLLMVVINSGYYIRNYRLAHNLLGIDKTEAKVYSNEQMNARLFVSALVKNAALHMEMMFAKPVEIWTDSTVHKFHRAIGIDVDNPAVNYRNMKFGLNADVTCEDNAPNPLHFMLILFAFITMVVFWKKTRKVQPALLLLIVVVLQIILFCAYLKWQPWHSRLHTPVFLMCVPLIVYTFSLGNKLADARYIIAPILLAYALLVALHNDMRPVNAQMFTGDRYKKYFVDKPDAYGEYAQIKNQLQHNNFKNIGLIFGVDDWEYPLFTNCYSTTLNPIYIDVDNITRNSDTTKKQVDCIISTRKNIPFIDYNKRRYYNQDKGNKLIYLYQ